MRKKQDNEPKNILRKSFLFFYFRQRMRCWRKHPNLDWKFVRPSNFFFFKNFFLFWWTWTRQFTLRQFDRDSSKKFWYLALRHSSDTSKCILKLLLSSSKFRNKSSTFRKNVCFTNVFFYILSFQLNCILI